LSHELKDVKFAKVNVDENNSLASQNGVLGIPCIIIYKNGEEVERVVGFQDEASLKKKLTAALQ